MAIKEDIQSLSPGAVVELFELDATNLPGGTVSYFHAGTSELSKPIVWQGITYSPLPVEASGFDISTNGTLPRPRFKVANVGGVFSAVARENEDLVGCKVTRRRTFAKYLDLVNLLERNGTAQGGDNNSLTLDALASNVNEQYVGKTLYLSSGPGSTQAAQIINYDGATKVATIEANWKQNLFKWSNDPLNAIWFKNDLSVVWDSTEQASKTTVTGADPFCGQHVAMNTNSKTITFSFEAKAVGAAIGKQLSIYIYRGNPSGSITANNFFATGEWKVYSYTKTFDAVDATTLSARIDFPQTGAVIGDQLLFRNAHVFEGSSAEYIETSTAGIFRPNNTTTFEVRHSDYGSATPDPNQYFPDDIWFVEQKLNENKYVVEWELTSVFDLQGVMLPARQIIQDSCPWKYRGAECGYTGTAYFDLNDQVTTLSNDFCAKHLSSCKLRFPNQPLPFGGFPGAVRFVV